MNFQDILIRLSTAFIFSAIIGYERERNQSNAGIKTHSIVGVSAAMIALIQTQIIHDTIQFAKNDPSLLGVVRSDPSRLIAQIISGIGFLGAGTIIVTRRNILGLTTAATIWSVAAIGMALGMGYTIIATTAFLILFIILFILKRFFNDDNPRRIIIKYIGVKRHLNQLK